jgi:hypothetical protein
MENTGLNADKTIVLLKILTRSSAWALFACVIILVFSGWGITQTGVIYDITGGLIDRRLADAIHRAANVPVVFFFLAHVFINISLAALRKSRFSLADQCCFNRHRNCCNGNHNIHDLYSRGRMIA